MDPPAPARRQRGQRRPHEPRRIPKPYGAYGKGSGLAREGAERLVGNVHEWSDFLQAGSIHCQGFAKDEIKFDVDEVPKRFFEDNAGAVPPGVQVEFDLGELKDGTKQAYNLVFPPYKTFVELGLKPEVVRGAAAALGCDPRENPDAPNLISPAPVQTAAIPKFLTGEDLVIAAETGSGKSLAYMLPLVQEVRVVAKERSLDYGLAFRAASPIALVICPTRELAMQANKVLKLICHEARLRVRCVYGGTGTWVKQRREISQVVDVLVATPDRCLKFFRENDLKFSDVRHICIDEADFLLTQGFADLLELLDEIKSDSRHGSKIRYTLITASITKPLWRLFQEDPRWRNLKVLESKALHKPQANCSHAFLITKGRDRLQMLISLLYPEVAGDAPSKQTLVFCNTVSSAKSISFKLREHFERNRANRFIGRLHKEMPAEERQEVLRRFTRGELRVVICTDVAQRGIDLPNCGHVINFDFPMNSIDYLHRAGRTARFGEAGKVTSLVKKQDKVLAKAIERSCQLGKPIDDLSSDRRDYLRGGALHHLLARQPHASAAERGLPPPRPYDGSLR